MKTLARALGLLTMLAACKESRPTGLTSTDVPVTLGDSGPSIDVPASDVPAAPDRPAADAPSTRDVLGPRDTGPLIEQPFRPIAPLSGAYVRSLRPTFRWSPLTGATTYRIEYSSTRAFTAVESSATSGTTSHTPAADLPRGLRWWRVVGLNGASKLRTSAVWPVTLGRVRHDLNGDGRADVVIGSPGRDSGPATPTGAVYVHLGAAAVPAQPTLTLSASAQGERFGTSVSTSGDVNGDGYADLLVGAGYFRADATETTQSGRAALYLGGAAPATSPALRIAAPAPAGGFGRSLNIVGDVNGDGYADWVVGAPAYDRLTGRAWLYLGGATPDGSPDLEYSFAMPSDGFGTAIARAGDLNGDGFADVAIGAPQTVGATTGEVRVFFGGAVPNATVDVNLVGGAASDIFGTTVAGAGDFNGDGYGDLAIGAPSIAGAGQVVVFAGAAGSLNQRLLDVRGALVGAAGEKLGGALDGAGDFNGDGFDDLVVGASANATNGADSGRAYVFAGGATPATSPSIAFSSLDTSGGNVLLLGNRATGAGDVDGDGFDDVLVRAGRAPANVGREGGPGAVFLFRGGATPATTPAWTSVGEGTSQINEYGYGLALRGVARPRYF